MFINGQGLRAKLIESKLDWRPLDESIVGTHTTIVTPVAKQRTEI